MYCKAPFLALTRPKSNTLEAEALPYITAHAFCVRRRRIVVPFTCHIVRRDVRTGQNQKVTDGHTAGATHLVGAEAAALNGRSL